MARGITTGYYGSTDGSNGSYTTQDIYGSAAGANQSRYIPELFSKNVLVQFYNESTAVQLVNTSYEGDIKGAGDSVVIRKDPTVSTKEYSIGGTIDYEVPIEDAITMSVDQFRVNAFRIDTIDDLQSDVGLPNRFQNACMESMKQVIDEELFNYMVGGVSNGGAVGTAIADATGTLIDPSNYGATAGVKSGAYNLGTELVPVGTTTSNIKEMLINLNAALREAKTDGNWFVMSPAVAALLKLTDLSQADVTGDSTGMVRTGHIGKVDGSDIYVTNNLPIASTYTSNQYILAGNSQFCSFASQIVESQTLPIPDSFGEYYRSLSVYARKVVQPTAASMAIVTV